MTLGYPYLQHDLIAMVAAGRKKKDDPATPQDESLEDAPELDPFGDEIVDVTHRDPDDGLADPDEKPEPDAPQPPPPPKSILELRA